MRHDDYSEAYKQRLAAIEQQRADSLRIMKSSRSASSIVEAVAESHDEIHAKSAGTFPLATLQLLQRQLEKIRSCPCALCSTCIELLCGDVIPIVDSVIDRLVASSELNSSVDEGKDDQGNEGQTSRDVSGKVGETRELSGDVKT